tara:strand:+ start:14916 stop:15170 length:255 start_codon:yes stop_codon:yes gene_type:complete
MAVTLNQMAEAYVAQVEEQLEAAKAQAVQATQYAQQLEQHLAECKSSVQEQTQVTPFAPEPVANTETTQVALPNPFESTTKSED